MNEMRNKAAMESLRSGDFKRLTLYLKHGVDPSPLIEKAVAIGNLEAVALLINAGAKVDPNGNLLIYCNRAANRTCFEFMLDTFVFSANALQTALADAACYDESEICELLLGKGALPDKSDENGNTPLMNAVVNKAETVSLVLLKYGADPTKRIPVSDGCDFCRMTVVEAARKQKMQAFLEKVLASKSNIHGNLTTQVGATIKPDMHSAISTILRFIDGLPQGLTLNGVPPLFPLNRCVDYLKFLGAHDGSGEIELIPVPSENSYSLLSYMNSLETYKLMIDSTEHQSSEMGTNWSLSWLPIAENGAGDLLCIDSENGQVYAFNHELGETKLHADNFTAMIADLALGLESGFYRYDTDTRSVH